MTLSSNTCIDQRLQNLPYYLQHRMLSYFYSSRSHHITIGDTVRHRGAMTKAERHAAKDGLACTDKFLRDFSLCYSRDAEVRARGMGQSPKT